MTGLELLDVPFELVIVTVTAVNGTVVPGAAVYVNCTVIVNWPPKAVEAALLYQVVNAAVSGTATFDEVSVAFVGATNVNTALVISRVDENPVTEMLNPLRVTVPIVTPFMTGGVAFTVTTVGAGGGSEVPLES